MLNAKMLKAEVGTVREKCENVVLGKYVFCSIRAGLWMTFSQFKTLVLSVEKANNSYTVTFK